MTLVRRPRPGGALAVEPKRLENVAGVVRGLRFEQAGAGSSGGIDVAAEATRQERLEITT